MARKRVNKNLVAFLTIMGMLLTVIVVALGTSQVAKKDPEFWAGKARQEEQGHDYEVAIQMWQRAYNASEGRRGAGRDVSYLVEAARCAFEWGEIGATLGLLERAHAEQPDHVGAIVAYLERVWDVFRPERYWELRPEMRSRMLEYAQALEDVEARGAAPAPHVVGPLSLAVARWAMADEGPDNLAQGDAALTRAIQLAENDPRVVRARIERERAKTDERTRLAQQQAAGRPEIEGLRQEFQDGARQILRTGLEAAPADWRLVGVYVGELRAQAQGQQARATELRAQGQGAEAEKAAQQAQQHMQDARAVLERALAEKENDPDLRLLMARLAWQEAYDQRSTLSPDGYAQRMDEAVRQARAAVRQEPALYEAWVLLAQCELTREPQPAQPETIAPERYRAALQVYDEAIQATVGARSLHATLGEYVQRRLMHARAFQTALSYVAGATTPQERTERGAWLTKFLEAAAVRYEDEAFTYYMRGQAAIVQGDLTAALQAFKLAEQRASGDASGRYPALWFEVFNGVVPLQRLAVLYREHNQPGESLRCTEQALEQHERLFRGGQPAPLVLVLNRLELLNELGRAQEARDYAAGIHRAYAPALAGDQTLRLRLAAAEASAATKLNLPQEAQRILQTLDPADIRATFAAAQAALTGEDWGALEEVLQKLTAREDLTAEMAAQMLPLLQPLTKAGRTAAAGQILASVRQRFGQDAALSRALDQVAVLVQYGDTPEARAKWFELIAQEPDPVKRAAAYFNYYLGTGEWAKANEHLEALEKARPDDPALLVQRFSLELRLAAQAEKPRSGLTGAFDRAAQASVRLGQQDVDHAGGATFRGQLALAQGKPDEAVKEFLAARDRLPRSSALQTALGQALLMANRPVEAVEALEDAVAANPRDFEANKLLYVAYQMAPPERRPADGGDSYLLIAAKLNPNDTFIQQRAEEIAEKTNPRAGIAKREQRRTEAPQDVTNLIRLAQLYAKVGDEVRAAERFAEAVKIEPASRDSAGAVAVFFATAGRRAEGETLLRAFLEAQPAAERWQAYRVLAQFYDKLADAAATETAYQDAKRAVEEAVEGAEARRQALLEIGFDLMDFYRRTPGRETEMIDASRWAIDKLRADEPGDAWRRRLARLTVVQGLLVVGRLGEAESEIGSFLRDYPEDAAALAARAQLKMSQRQWTEAYQTLGQVVQKVPDNVWALSTRGRLSMRYGRYVEALEDLRRARTLLAPPDDAAARQRWAAGDTGQQYLSISFDVAEVYEIQKSFELAENELREVLRLAGTSAEALPMVDQVAERLITLLRHTDQLEKARDVSSEYMQRYPNVAGWPYRFALVYNDLGLKALRQAEAARKGERRADEQRLVRESQTQYQTAADYFQRAAGLATSEPRFAAQCAAFRLDALAAGGQAGPAAREFEQLVSSVREVPAIVRAAVIRVYVALKREPDALTQLEQALEAAARDSAATMSAVLGLASEYVRFERVTEVLRAVTERSSPTAPEGARLRTSLGTHLMVADNLAEAARVIDAVLAKPPPDTPEFARERASATMVRAQILDRADDVPQAVALLEQILQTYPNHSAAMNNLAYLLTDRANRPQEALPYAERARELNPRSVEILDTLGWVYFRVGRFEEAEATLKQALGVEPDDVASTYHLGVLYADRGKTAEARATLRRAETLAADQHMPEFEEKAKAALEKLP